MMLPKDAKIYVTGHTELVGGALVRQLRRLGYDNILTCDERHYDLRDQDTVNAFFERELPDYVLLSSARVRGVIGDAIYPAQWLRDNLMIATNVIHAAYLYEVEKLLNLDCGYALLGLTLPSLQDETHRAELLAESGRACDAARRATVELCDSYRAQYGCDFISAVVTALYGPAVDVENASGHFLPALVNELMIARTEQRNTVVIPGNGDAPSGLLYIEDLARACLEALEHHSGAGAVHLAPVDRVTLRDVAERVASLLQFEGRVEFRDEDSPVRRAAALATRGLQTAGWESPTPLEEGVRVTCAWLVQHHLIAARH